MEKSAIRENQSRVKTDSWGKERWCGVKFEMSLCCVSSLLGKRGLEVCGHGHWQDIPLDVCTGVHTGICWTLSPSLAGWNDLDTPHRREGNPQTLTERHAVLYCKKKKKRPMVFHFYFYFLFYKSQSLLLPQVKRLLTTQLNIYHWFQW